ncbi:MAG: 2-hydroxyacid dehydrogenase [Acidobacteria bacterium]|nr:2-hydroxyacid dehydrogenase [Acidobacteriota bacterium]
MHALSDVTILVPGPLHERALQRIGESFTLRKVDQAAVDCLSPELAGEIRGVAGTGAIGAAFIDALPHLEIIASFGVGWDGIDVSHAGAAGVIVTNTPDVATEEVADTAVGLLLNTVREFPRAEAWLRAGRWQRDGPYPLTATTLRGRRAGIFGMGRIGQAIARRLHAFGIPVAYHNRNPISGSPSVWYPSLKALASAVDTLICAVPGGPSTERAVDADVLTALGADGILVNIGRGATIDEDALMAALARGTIRAAGLDVFADEPHVPAALLTLGNVSLLPHVGTASEHTRGLMADLVVDNLISWFSEGRPLTPVPDAAHPRA